jgi:acylphosphatase
VGLPRAKRYKTVSGQKKAVRFYVSGLVQGVGYRYFAHHAAQELGVFGYVRNLRDGRVEVLAIGGDSQLRALRTNLERGPLGSMVEGVAETAADVPKEFASDFSIEYDQ